LVYLGGVLNRLTGWRLSTLNVWIYRATRGVLGDATPGSRVILLTTTGRKTGELYTVPVASFPLGADLIVGAHAGGARTDPHWIRNLRTNPSAKIQLKREVFSVRAEEVADDERDVVVKDVARTHPAIGFYERQAKRRVPIVRLVRQG
jgi:deazaflavin-dependent oxidoreductase (nitroreductase family)